MHRLAVVLVATLIACPAARPDSEPTGDNSSGGESSGLVAEPPPDEGSDDAGVIGSNAGARAAGACPTRYGELSPRCTEDDVPVSCTYPEGTCGCSTGTWCGGAAPPPMPLAWICWPNRAPCPAQGTPCSGGESCPLDDCGFVGMRCERGVWTSFHGPFPP